MKEKLAHKPFETTLKEMAERDPKPWMGLLLGRPVRDVEVINADLPTIAAEADKLFRIAEPSPHLVHSEFETSYKAEHPRKGLRYSVLARVRHGLPVQTIFVLLRPEADGPAFTGTLEDEWPVGTRYLHFRYNVLRIWEMPPQVFLKGDLATLPWHRSRGSRRERSARSSARSTSGSGGKQAQTRLPCCERPPVSSWD